MLGSSGYMGAAEAFVKAFIVHPPFGTSAEAASLYASICAGPCAQPAAVVTAPNVLATPGELVSSLYLGLRL
jgi:hypothetical protein